VNIEVHQVPAASSPALESGPAVARIERGREIFRLEASGIASLAARLGVSFAESVERILACTGRVIVTGVGKSGLAARKIAATFASTGTPAFFLHPSEGVHGDVGGLLAGDLLVVVSNSGCSAEVLALLPWVRERGIPVVALTGTPESPLARAADVNLDVGVPAEACPHELAPTSSTTAAMTMGDALAIVLLEARGFGPQDFARLHPAGALGRRLLWRVRDVMVRDEAELPGVSASAPLSEAMNQMAHLRGTVPVLDRERCVIGVITAGDLTRFAAANADFLTRPVYAAMNRSPRTIGPEALASEAAQILQRYRIMALPVVNEGGQLDGIVHLHDLLRAGVQ